VEAGPGPNKPGAWPQAWIAQVVESGSIARRYWRRAESVGSIRSAARENSR